MLACLWLAKNINQICCYPLFLSLLGKNGEYTEKLKTALNHRSETLECYCSIQWEIKDVFKIATIFSCWSLISQKNIVLSLMRHIFISHHVGIEFYFSKTKLRLLRRCLFVTGCLRIAYEFVKDQYIFIYPSQPLSKFNL